LYGGQQGAGKERERGRRRERREGKMPHLCRRDKRP